MWRHWSCLCYCQNRPAGDPHGPYGQGRRQWGASDAQPPLEICAPHFPFGPLVAAYIQYSILKMWPPFWFLAPPTGFWPPLLLNPGDGPAYRQFIARGHHVGDTWFRFSMLLASVVQPSAFLWCIRVKWRTNKFSKLKFLWRTYSHYLKNNELKTCCYFAFEVTLYYGLRAGPGQKISCRLA